MSMKDCIEHLYSWDYTIPDALGCPGCAERERIIKLLEEEYGEWIDIRLETFIALIKGENK